jgi:purine-nucleoside phosphorylase
MQGRVHLYEGHDAHAVVFGVRLMVTLGARIVIVTNASGGICEGLGPGSLMLIEDQLNLTGRTCLLGPNEAQLGPRFPSMTGADDPELRALAQRAAVEAGLSLQTGVYAGVLGPAYETPAEVRMLAAIGADAVGMSTVLEVIAARHMGARVLGLSCITNAAAGLGGATLNHEEVQETADRVRDRFVSLLGATLRRMG